MIVQLAAVTPGGHVGATSGVLVAPSSTTAASAKAGTDTAAKVATAVMSMQKRFISSIEHDFAAAVAPRSRESQPSTQRMAAAEPPFSAGEPTVV
jgi:gas vesicle protein